MDRLLGIVLALALIGNALASEAAPPASRLEAVPRDFLPLANNVGQILLKVPAFGGGGGEDTKEICTGLAISRRLIVTARHCFHELTGGSTVYTGIIFWRGRTGQDPSNSGMRHNLKKDFVEDNPAIDLVVLETVEPMPADVGLNLQYSLTNLETGKSLFILHHPGEGSMVLTRFECQTFNPAIDNGLLFHTCDTSPGSSGAPIFNLESKIVGFHQRGGRTNDPATYNSGVTFGTALSRLAKLTTSIGQWKNVAAPVAEEVLAEYRTDQSNYYIQRGINWSYRVGGGTSYKIYDQSTEDGYWEFWRPFGDQVFKFPKAGGSLLWRPSPNSDWTEIGVATKIK